MKRTIILLLCVGVIVPSLMIWSGGPSSRWRHVSPGMSDAEINTAIGRPDNELLRSKGLQIWKNNGLIRTSWLVVEYNDPAHPNTSTSVAQSRQWIWQRYSL